MTVRTRINNKREKRKILWVGFISLKEIACSKEKLDAVEYVVALVWFSLFFFFLLFSFLLL